MNVPNGTHRHTQAGKYALQLTTSLFVLRGFPEKSGNSGNKTVLAEQELDLLDWTTPSDGTRVRAEKSQTMSMRMDDEGENICQ